MSAGPTIVAHRGLHEIHPENSLAAFRAAWDAGFEWCECDVQEARDGTLVVIHDDTLDRTTEGSGRVVDHNVDALRRMRLRRSDGTLADERIATLDDLLGVVRPGEGLLLEIKPMIPKGPRWSALTRLGNRRVVVQSFHLDVVSAAAELDLRTAWLSDDPGWIERIVDLPGALSFNIRHDLIDRARVDRVHDEGRSIGAWTVSEPADITRVLRLGVDMIITDEPYRVRDATESLKSGT